MKTKAQLNQWNETLLPRAKKVAPFTFNRRLLPLRQAHEPLRPGFRQIPRAQTQAYDAQIPTYKRAEEA